MNPKRYQVGDFSDKIAIVTGAAQGLGHAYTQALLDRGARVVASDLGTDRAGRGSDEGLIYETARTLIVKDGDLRLHSGRLDSEAECKQLIEFAIAQFGGVDILINNAGWVDYQAIEEQENEFFERAMDINVRAPIWLTKHAWPHLKRSAAGRIVLTTSDRAMFRCYAKPGLVVYAAGKMAQVGIMNALSAEGESWGIRVNAISPVAKTRMWGIAEPPTDLKPEWVAPGVLYLASSLCLDTGVILRASNGHFTATRFFENAGVDYPLNLARVKCSTVEEVAQNWERIREHDRSQNHKY